MSRNASLAPRWNCLPRPACSAAGRPNSKRAPRTSTPQPRATARPNDEGNRVARALLALGVQKGGRVGIWSTNCVAWVLVQFATAKTGAVLVNLNPAYRLHELEFALRQSDCHVLISGPGFKNADYAGMLQGLVPELACADPNTDLHAPKFPHLRRLIFLGGEAKAGFLAWDALLNLATRVSPEA